MTKTKQSADFEKSLSELENIVKRMEKGDQKLSDALKDFERGMLLSEQCQTSLNEAQLKVEKLVKKHQANELQLLDSDADNIDSSEDES